MHLNIALVHAGDTPKWKHCYNKLTATVDIVRTLLNFTRAEILFCTVVCMVKLVCLSNS